MLTHLPDLASIRARFILQGTTFRSWCRQNGIDPGYAHKVAAGLKNGPKAKQLRSHIAAAAAQEQACA